MKKFLKNIISSSLPQIMNVITNLILPSYMIFRFGSELNGLVSSIKTIISYISIVGAGIATATTQSLYEPVAKKDIEKIKGMLNATNIMFTKYGIIFCIIAFIVALLYPFIIKSNVDYIVMVLLMLVMSLSGMSEFFAIGRCRSLLYADQKTYVCTTIQALSILLSLICAIILLNLNASIILVQLSISMVYVFRAIFLTNYVKKNYPQLSNFKRTKPVLSATEKRKDAMVHQLSGLAVLGSQTTILGVFVGLNSVSIYSVYNIVLTGIQSIFFNLNTAITPYLGKEYALKNNKRLKRMYDLVEFSSFYLIAFVISVTMLMIVPFVKLYTAGADISYEYPLFAILFCNAVAFYMLKMPSNALINVSGLFKETKWRAILEGVLTIVLGTIFTLVFGLTGVIIGTFIALLWRCFDTIMFSNKYVLKTSNKGSLARLSRIVTILIIYSILSFTISINVNNYFEWILYGLVISIITIIFIIIILVLFERRTIGYLFEKISLLLKNR